jgi:hypothetical protein
VAFGGGAGDPVWYVDEACHRVVMVEIALRIVYSRWGRTSIFSRKDPSGPLSTSKV